MAADPETAVGRDFSPADPQDSGRAPRAFTVVLVLVVRLVRPLPVSPSVQRGLPCPEAIRSEIKSSGLRAGFRRSFTTCVQIIVLRVPRAPHHPPSCPVPRGTEEDGAVRLVLRACRHALSYSQVSQVVAHRLGVHPGMRDALLFREVVNAAPHPVGVGAFCPIRIVSRPHAQPRPLLGGGASNARKTLCKYHLRRTPNTAKMSAADAFLVRAGRPLPDPNQQMALTTYRRLVQREDEWQDTSELSRAAQRVRPCVTAHYVQRHPH